MKYIESVDEKTYQVKLLGKFTFFDHSDFKHILEHIKEARYDTVNIDFSEVSFIDSAALGLLLLLRDETEKINTKVTLYRPQGQVKKMLDVSRFEEIFSIIDQ